MKAFYKIYNAVAPDWNLKADSTTETLIYTLNAVAPDWNLKMNRSFKLYLILINAVAPDWNLKHKNSVRANCELLMQSHQIGI